MEIISNCTQHVIKKAAKALKDGHLVAFPTETVYGLGADATNEKAVSRIYSTKGRPTDHPLIVHISSIKQLDKWSVDIPDYGLKLAREFWPGPMTLILKRSELAKDFITGGQDNVGIRVPNHAVTSAILIEFEKKGGCGVVAPSANRFGAVSPTKAIDVQIDLGEYLGGNDLIIEGGACLVGIESTIINCTEDTPKILRPGFITSSMIKELTGITVKVNASYKKIKAAGLLESHYSPRATIIVNDDVVDGDGYIALSKLATPPGLIRLASPVDVFQFAAQLYSAFRLGDAMNIKRIAVVLPDDADLGTAIRDRVIKASNSKLNQK